VRGVGLHEGKYPPFSLPSPFSPLILSASLLLVLKREGGGVLRFELEDDKLSSLVNI
jgi:hypothetical protein